MAVNKTEYYDWQKGTKVDRVRFRSASPNLVTIKDYLLKRYGGTNVGIVANRNQRGSDTISTHAFGAALDWRYGTRVSAKKAMTDLVQNSKEWGVQMVVDYVGGVIWTPTRGWHKATPNEHGMGQAWAQWLHIETTKSAWGDKRALDKR